MSTEIVYGYGKPLPLFKPCVVENTEMRAAVVEVFQIACWKALDAIRNERWDDRDVFFNLADTLEAAFPKIIGDYKRSINVGE